MVPELKPLTAVFFLLAEVSGGKKESSVAHALVFPGND